MDPERQEPASPASASNKEELREKVKRAIHDVYFDTMGPGNWEDRAADAAIAAGAGTGDEGLLCEIHHLAANADTTDLATAQQALHKIGVKLRAIAAMRGRERSR